MKSEERMRTKTRRRDTEDFKQEAGTVSAGISLARSAGGTGLRDSRESVVSLARPTPASRIAGHHTSGSTYRGRGTHAAEARVDAGDSGAGFLRRAAAFFARESQ